MRWDLKLGSNAIAPIHYKQLAPGSNNIKFAIAKIAAVKAAIQE